MQGVDLVACTAVNDAFVLDVFAKHLNSDGKITFLSVFVIFRRHSDIMQDGNADFAKKIGMDKEFRDFFLGVRTQRYAMYLEDGVVKYLGHDQNPLEPKLSKAEAILQFLEKN